MALSRYIFDVIDTVLGEHSPRQIAVGTVLGLFLAVSPWLTAQGAGLLLIALVLRVNIFSTAAGFLFFSGLEWIFEGPLDAFGIRVLTGHPALTGAWAWAYHAPLLPFTLFYNSVVMGGTLLAVAAALPLYFGTLWLTRRSWKRGVDRLNSSRFWSRWKRSELNSRFEAGKRNPFFRRVAFLPLAMGALVVTLYMLVLFDSNLERYLESQASFYNTAKVDIGHVRTRFWRGTVDIEKIEVADPIHPNDNLIEIDQVHMIVRPSLFLRKKLRIDDMQVRGIHYHSPRKNSGALPFELTYGVPKVFDRSSQDSFPALAQTLGDNPFRHVMKLLNNSAEIDAVIGGLRGDLESTKRLAALSGQLQKITEDRTPASASREGVDDLRQSALGLDATIEPDTQTIWNKLGFAHLDDDDYTRFLFGPRLLSSLERTSYWVGLSRRYMPKALQQGQFTLTFQPRAHGTSIHYGGAGGWPSFMLVHASFSSDPDPATKRGRVTGSLANLNTDPAICGCVTTFDLEADFPDTGVLGARVSMLINHTRFNFHESLRIGIDSFPLKDWTISHTDDFSLAIRQSAATLIYFGQFDDDVMRAEAKLRVQNAEYDAHATSPELADDVQSVTSQTPEFMLHASAEGPFSDVKLAATSDLGRRLAASFTRDYHERMVVLRRALRRALSDNLESRREKFLTELAAASGRAERP